MKNTRPRKGAWPVVLAVVAVPLLLALAQRERAPGSRPPIPAAHPEGAQLLARLPAAFVPNEGQWPQAARYAAKIAGGAVFLEDHGFLLTWCTDVDAGRRRGASLRLRLAGGGDAAELVPEQRLAGRHTYLRGNDPARWHDAPLYGAVRYRAPWPGVDVVCYEKGGHLEYDVALLPGADLAPVEFAVEGARSMQLDRDGALVLETAAGTLRQPPPATYEIGVDGERRPVAARYELRGTDRFGFAAPQWSGRSRLVIDPGLLWSTFVGSVNDDGANDLFVDAAGIVTITGNTFSPTYPTTVGAWSTSLGGVSDVHVTRLDPSRPAAQQLLYSTFLGGTGDEYANKIAVDAAGVVTITGYTNSADFPTTAGAWNTVTNGLGDVFVTRLDPALPAAQQLVYSTFVGGMFEEAGQALSVDPAGVVTIAGYTDSTNYPTTANAWSTTRSRPPDVFVTQLDPALPAAQQLVYSTFVGGSGYDSATALFAEPQGLIFCSGMTTSSDFPTTAGAWNTAHNGGADAFVTILLPTQPPAVQILYSTFLGGAGDDSGSGLLVEAAGITITGGTNSANYPTTAGAWDTSYNGGSYDGFLTRLDPWRPTAQQLLYSTFLGGAGEDAIGPVAVDASGIVTVVGRTGSPDFPITPGAWDTSYNGGTGGDLFVLRLDPLRPAAQQLLYSTFLGGASVEFPSAVAVDAAGIATITGATQSWAYPTTAGAWDPTHNARWDAFVTRLDLLPTGVSAYGASTPGCRGPLRSGVVAWPQVGNASFEFTCAGAPPNSLGLLAVGTAGVTTPVLLAGASVWIDLQSPVVTLLVPSTGVGSAYAPVPIPARPALAGLRAFPQFFWLDGCASAGVSASNALAITLQP